MNERTGKYVGGGAVIGALVGGGGAGAQVLTGKKKGLPGEPELSHRTAQDLYMSPSTSSTELQKRSASH